MAPPPGYVAYGSAPTPTQRVRRIKGLSTAIMVLVGIAGVGGLLNAILTAGLRSDAEDLLAGRISETDFNDQLLSSSAFTALAGVATIVAMVLIMIWMYRIATNLRAFGMSTTWHPLFAVFGWFLPPAILYVIPFLMLREQWSKSTASATPGQAAAPMSDGGKSENPVLWVWWLTFGIWPLVALFLSTDSLVGNFGDTSAEAVAQSLVDTSSAITIIGSVIGLIAAAAWILFVRQMAARHQSLTGER
jgi:ABC-type Fe3+ transport system permease subunit